MTFQESKTQYLQPQFPPEYQPSELYETTTASYYGGSHQGVSSLDIPNHGSSSLPKVFDKPVVVPRRFSLGHNLSHCSHTQKHPTSSSSRHSHPLRARTLHPSGTSPTPSHKMSSLPSSTTSTMPSYPRPSSKPCT